jgi:site-specific DNA recombinase
MVQNFLECEDSNYIGRKRIIMKTAELNIKEVNTKPRVRCAIYTRKSNDEGLEQSFNSLDAQRLAGESYIASQAHEGWECLHSQYNDGGYSGGNMERPGLQRLFQDIKNGKIDCIVVYKIDRLTRSLLDFSKIIELLDEYKCSFVAVTQSFNTSNSMGRLMLNVLLSFAQYERELTSERIRDKFAASCKLGIWMGGTPPLGYDPANRELHINTEEAETIKLIYQQFLETESVTEATRFMNKEGYRSKSWTSQTGKVYHGKSFNKNMIRYILQNPIYAGKIEHKGNIYQGKHQPIIDLDTWEKVQAIFAVPECRITKPTTRVSSTPLLKGLFFCGCCASSMTPSYTAKKNGTRYRYYICTNKLRGIEEKCAVRSISAAEVEGLVTAQILQLIKSPEIVAMTIAHAANTRNSNPEEILSDEQIINALKDTSKVWDELFPIEQARLTRMFIRKVTIKPTGIDIQIYNEGLHLLKDELTQEAA